MSHFGNNPFEPAPMGYQPTHLTVTPVCGAGGPVLIQQPLFQPVSNGYMVQSVGYQPLCGAGGGLNFERPLPGGNPWGPGGR